MERDFNQFFNEIVNNSSISIVKCIEDFETFCELRNLSRHTMKNYQVVIDRFYSFLILYHEPCINDINAITESTVQEYLFQRKASVTASSVNLDILSLKSFFNFCYKKKYVYKNPMENIVKMKVDKKVRRVLSNSDFQKLTSCCNLINLNETVSYVLLHLLYYSAMRISEACNLTMNDVNLTTKTIHITKAKNRHARIIPINNKLLKILRVYVNVRGPVGTDSFLINNNEKPLTIRNAQHKIQVVCKRAGIENVSCHTFRRSAITHMLENGTDVITVARISGHKNIGTLNEYAFISEKHLEDEINKL